jgi:hypothetical protein
MGRRLSTGAKEAVGVAEVTIEGVLRRHPVTSRHHAATSRRLLVASCAASGRASPPGDFNPDLKRWVSVPGEIRTESISIPDKT